MMRRMCRTTAIRESRETKEQEKKREGKEAKKLL